MRRPALLLAVLLSALPSAAEEDVPSPPELRRLPYAEDSPEDLSRYRPLPRPRTPPLDSAVVRGLNAFGFAAFRSLAEEDPTRNLLVSPLAMARSLAALARLSGPDTAAPIRRALGHAGLHPDSADRFLRASLARLLDSGSEAGIYARSGASLWMDSARPAPARRPEAAHPFRLHFGGLARTDSLSGIRIAEWVKRASAGRIPTGELAGRRFGPAFLHDFLFLQGYGERAFTLAADSLFLREDSTLVSVPRLRMQDTAASGRFDSLHAIAIPFWKGRYSLVVVVPETGRRLRDVLPALTADRWETWLGRLRVRKVEAEIPALALDGSQGSEQGFPGLGGLPAWRHAASFRLDGSRNKAIENLLRRREIHFGPALLVRDGTERRSLLADRPFFFAVRENATGALVLLGRVMDPAAPRATGARNPAGG